MSTLQRTTALPGAVLLGLGSMLGTGAYVAIALAIPLAGSAWATAILAAGFLALCNGLSSARLASAYPKSGGAYEYGYLLLHPTLGSTAGWAFLLAKSCSAATAVLSILLLVKHSPLLQIPLALAIPLLITALAASGLRRSNVANSILLTLALLGLGTIIFAATKVSSPIVSLEGKNLPSWLHATALLFVAYTGYGRVATMGEEIRDPARNIPRAVIATITTTFLIYLAIGWACTKIGGAPALIEKGGTMATLIIIGALAALLGVLLNLILGLSRVALAMARRNDLPSPLAKLNKAGTSPLLAVWFVGISIALLAAFGSIETAWSFSAFTVLIYYGILNLAALRLPHKNLVDRIVPILGLIGCLGLAFWVTPSTWIAGSAILVVTLLWHFIRQRIAK